MKKSFEFKVIVKGCDKDFGLGVGVISEQTVEYTFKRKGEEKGAMFARTLLETQEAMVEDVIDVKVKEVP